MAENVGNICQALETWWNPGRKMCYCRSLIMWYILPERKLEKKVSVDCEHQNVAKWGFLHCFHIVTVGKATHWFLRTTSKKKNILMLMLVRMLEFYFYQCVFLFVLFSVSYPVLLFWAVVPGFSPPWTSFIASKNKPTDKQKKALTSQKTTFLIHQNISVKLNTDEHITPFTTKVLIYCSWKSLVLLVICVKDQMLLLLRSCHLIWGKKLFVFW